LQCECDNSFDTVSVTSAAEGSTRSVLTPANQSIRKIESQERETQVEKLVKSSLFSMLILFLPGLVFAEMIKVGYSAIARNQLPAWVAKEGEIFWSKH
jgi:hypothetical protein